MKNKDRTMLLRLRITQSIAVIILMTSISSSYAQIQDAAEHVDVAQQTAEYAACIADEACDVATSVSENEMYGGIQQEYTVKGCKVTVYNDGPVKMVDEKTDEPCNAPLPKDHQFSKSKEVHTYQENDCIVTEQISMDGAADATMDCSKRGR